MRGRMGTKKDPGASPSSPLGLSAQFKDRTGIRLVLYGSFGKLQTFDL